MKHLTLLSLLFLSITASAQDVTSNNIVVPTTNAYEVVIPAAGKVEGANGTFFRSDVTIANLLNRPLTLSARWMPAPGQQADVRQLVFAAEEVRRFDDFVHNAFRQTGLGAVLLTAVTSTGEPDVNARFHVASRIYSPQPVIGGTTSQSFPAVPLSSVDVTSGVVTIFGLGAGDELNRFRANVGVANLDASREQSFVISFSQAGGTPRTITFSLPPRSMQQVNVSRSGYLPFVRVLNVTEGAQRSNRWVAYASSIDEITGDAWSELGVNGMF